MSDEREKGLAELMAELWRDQENAEAPHSFVLARLAVIHAELFAELASRRAVLTQHEQALQDMKRVAALLCSLYESDASPQAKLANSIFELICVARAAWEAQR